MIIGDQSKVTNPPSLDHARYDLTNALWVSLDAKEMECDVQAIGGIWDQFKIAYLCDVKVTQDACQLQVENRTGIVYEIHKLTYTKNRTLSTWAAFIRVANRKQFDLWAHHIDFYYPAERTGSKPNPISVSRDNPSWHAK